MTNCSCRMMNGRDKGGQSRGGRRNVSEGFGFFLALASCFTANTLEFVVVAAVIVVAVVIVVVIVVVVIVVAVA